MSFCHRSHKFIHFSTLHFSCCTHLLGIVGLGHPTWDSLNSQAKLQPYSSAVLEESNITQAVFLALSPGQRVSEILIQLKPLSMERSLKVVPMPTFWPIFPEPHGHQMEENFLLEILAVSLSATQLSGSPCNLGRVEIVISSVCVICESTKTS